MVAVLASTSRVYDDLDVSTARSLQESAQRLGELTQETAGNLWKMGRILADAQKKLSSPGNGMFMSWLEDEVGLNYRRAYRLIHIYQTFDFDTLSKTPFATSVLYTLSAPSVPHAARREAIRRADNGEFITPGRAQEIVQAHTPPPLPPLPPLPEKPPTPEYKRFEKEVLRPQLHDAGIEGAPQILSGQQAPLQLASEDRQGQAQANLHRDIFDVIKTVEVEDDEDVGRCASEVLGLLGQNNNIAIAAHFGAELTGGPKTLTDLLAVAACACGEYLPAMERDDRLRLRKRVLRVVDAMSLGGVGLPIYEHKLDNGQTCFSLLRESQDCA